MAKKPKHVPDELTIRRCTDSLGSLAAELKTPCVTCKHWHEGKLTCDAYPEEGIPFLISSGEVDHKRPFPGDQGIQYEADPVRMKAEADKQKYREEQIKQIEAEEAEFIRKYKEQHPSE